MENMKGDKRKNNISTTFTSEEWCEYMLNGCDFSDNQLSRFSFFILPTYAKKPKCCEPF
jgi:hypothetical protein